MNCANHPDRERIAFCQNCGKPLCQECMRTVGTAVYCEPCLAARLAGAANPAPQPGSYAYSDPASGPAGGTYTYTDPATGATATGTVPPHIPPGAPNPVLAGALGFIPGVGAMYNEQYAKGVVHLIVFAVLISLADNHGIFILFVFGWVFYMAFEAYHTSRARRDGLPLPNAFGLNDLGEKLGFGKSWHAPAASAAVPPDPYAAPYSAPYAAPYTAPSPGPAQPFASSVPPPNWGSAPAQPWQPYAPPVPSVPPVPMDDQITYPGNRFPAGALWLIGFGVLFLIANAGFFHGFSARLFFPVFMIALAVFIFVKKMTSFGGGIADDGSANYRYRVFRALRGSIWIALVGVLFFLDEFNILSWGHSWPLFIITAGVMTVLQSGAFNSAPIPPYGAPYAPGTPYGYPPQPPPATPPPPAAVSTSIVPTYDSHDNTHDQEGR